MKEIALHILDIAQNSISAGATLIKMEVVEPEDGLMTVLVHDNGRGMDQEMIKNVFDPYCTTRTTRKVGLGIPLFKHSAEQAGGRLTISSQQGRGTQLTASFHTAHIDCPPMGDIAGVISLLAGANPCIDFIYSHAKGSVSYVFDTREIKEILEEVPLSEPSVIRYMKEMIGENLKQLTDTA